MAYLLVMLAYWGTGDIPIFIALMPGSAHTSSAGGSRANLSFSFKA